MFSKATAKFVKQIDPEGSLIHVRRINDSANLDLLAIVLKRNSIWFWQKPRYQTTDFTFKKLLLGDEDLTVETSETEFLTYEGAFGDKLCGNITTEAGAARVSLEGQGTSKMQLSFGKLKKNELDVEKLLQDMEGRLVNMQHVLVQQLEKKTEALAVVKQRILTTNTCTITQTKKEECTLQGVLGLVGLLSRSLKVGVKDSGQIEVDSDCLVEIPPSTVIAYSVLELGIKKDGQFKPILCPGRMGGFESDTVSPAFVTADEVDAGKIYWSELLDGSQEKMLHLLAELPQLSRLALLQNIQAVMADRQALSCLLCSLDDMCFEDKLQISKQDELSERQRQLLSATISHIDGHGCTEISQSSGKAYFLAAHLLVSALEELPDEKLCILSAIQPDILDAFNTMMCKMKESKEPISVQSLPILLQEEQNLQIAERLLSSDTVTLPLRKESEKLWLEMGEEYGMDLVVLYLSVHGMSLLHRGRE